MNQFEKIIKYVAFFIGIILSIAIISVIVTVGVEMFSALFNMENEYINNNDKNINIYNKSDEKILSNDYSKKFKNIKSLDLDINRAQLNILKNDDLHSNSSEISVDVINKNNFINCYERNGILIIEDKTDKKSKINTSIINIYVPIEYQFENVELELGVMKSSIEYLNTVKFELDVGVGNLDVDEIIVAETCDIETNVGEVNIVKASLKNLNLKTGVSNFYFSGRILGINKIKTGIGNLTLNLDKQDLYTINTKLGTGNLKLNGKKCQNNSKYMDGNNIIDIQGGIGNIDITCQEK